MITLDGATLSVDSYRLIPIDDTIAGDHAIADEIDKLKKTVTEVVFASRGYSIDQHLARVQQDIPNTFTDIAASTHLSQFSHRRLPKSHECRRRHDRQWTDASRTSPGARQAWQPSMTCSPWARLVSA